MLTRWSIMRSSTWMVASTPMAWRTSGACSKRGLNGTYVSVPFHLFRYLDEQCFRFNNRATKDNPLNDADRFTFAMTQIAGKRLTYAELTGKVGETAV